MTGCTLRPGKPPAGGDVVTAADTVILALGTGRKATGSTRELLSSA